MQKDVRVTSKGQVTIPAAIRRALGIEPGDRLRFACEDGVADLRPVRPPGRFEKYRGVGAGVPGGRRAIQRWLRELRGR